MKYLALIALAALLLISSGCITVDKQATLDDGRKVYIDGSTGKATTEAVGEDGTKNAPLMLTEAAPWIGEVTSFGGNAPAPWGAILGLAGTVVTSGLGVYLGLKNRKKKALLAELITSIENDPAAVKAARNLDHSAALKETVANVTAGLVNT